MSSLVQEFSPIATRLKIQKYPSLYALAFVTTSLQVQANALELKEPKLLRTPVDFANRTPSTKLLNDSFLLFSKNVDTTLEKDDLEDFDNDILIKPNYVKEFKIKVKVLRVEKSLPKIHLD